MKNEKENGKYILDATCGARMMWFNKNHPNAIYMDNRIENCTSVWKSTDSLKERAINIKPDVLGDFTNIPFPDDTFNLVIFDPPHLVNIGENAWMRKKYGRLPENWAEVIRGGFQECMRVLAPCGTLIFKWSEIQISTREIINVIGIDPLFGHRSGKKAQTHWLCYMKLPKEG